MAKYTIRKQPAPYRSNYLKTHPWFVTTQRGSGQTTSFFKTFKQAINYATRRYSEKEGFPLAA